MSAVEHAYPTGDLNVPRPQPAHGRVLRQRAAAGATPRSASTGATPRSASPSCSAGEGELHLFDFEDRLAPVVERLARGRPHQRGRAPQLAAAAGLLQLEPDAGAGRARPSRCSTTCSWTAPTRGRWTRSPSAWSTGCWTPGGYVDFDDYALDAAAIAVDAPGGVPGRAPALQRRADRARAGRAGGRPAGAPRPAATTSWWPTRSSARRPPDARQRLHPDPKPGRRSSRAAIESALAQDVRRHGGAGARRRLGRRHRPGAGRDPRPAPARAAAPATAAASPPTATACVAAARGELRSPGSTPTTSTCRARSRARLAVLDARPQVGLVHGGFDVIDADGRPLRAWPAPHDHDCIEAGDEALPRPRSRPTTITTSTVVVRRSAQQAAGPFAASIGASSTDWDMWLRIALRGDVAYLAAPAGRLSPARPLDPARARCEAASGCAATCARSSTCWRRMRG